jgi:hypothetical protein
VRVRERKRRQEGEGLLATRTATTTNANPIVMLIMRLLAAASVTDDRVNLTPRASPQNNLGAARGPIRFELVQRSAKWDKQNRTSWSSAPALTRQDLSRKRSSFLLKPKIQLEENNPSGLQLLGVRFRILAGYNRQLAQNLVPRFSEPLFQALSSVSQMSEIRIIQGSGAGEQRLSRNKNS